MQIGLIVEAFNSQNDFLCLYLKTNSCIVVIPHALSFISAHIWRFSEKNWKSLTGRELSNLNDAEEEFLNTYFPNPDMDISLTLETLQDDLYLTVVYEMLQKKLQMSL